MVNLPWTSPERPIIWYRARHATGSPRHPVDIPIYYFGMFVLPVKYRNKYVIKGLWRPKYNFIVKSLIFHRLLESDLRIPLRFQTFREPLGDVPGKSDAGWVYANNLYWWVTSKPLSTSSYQLIDVELFKINNFNVDSPKGCWADVDLYKIYPMIIFQLLIRFQLRKMYCPVIVKQLWRCMMFSSLGSFVCSKFI